MERLENDRFEQFVCAGVHVRGCQRTKRLAGTRVVVVDTELAVVVVRSRQLKRRPNTSALAVNPFQSTSVPRQTYSRTRFLCLNDINQTCFLFVRL